MIDEFYEDFGVQKINKLQGIKCKRKGDSNGAKFFNRNFVITLEGWKCEYMRINTSVIWDEWTKRSCSQQISVTNKR